MDQKFISGIGNIYVNEILYLCKIKTYKKIKKLKDFELVKIVKNTKKVLKKQFYLGGSSIKDFSSSNGKKRKFSAKFNVYGRKGSKCSNKYCNKNIKKLYQIVRVFLHYLPKVIKKLTLVMVRYIHFKKYAKY